ncbi:hypothetical protein AAFF_G00171450 [Aldrovandia affinis]|uniref:Uncharacterized protein n=1 Tax=Aldrovandia affinis TaxID=143900 RepID=A0AAD7SYL0_9TELE|nr:hypothetical protein AAFF_G00171450 [Aldrovandia affinis]
MIGKIFYRALSCFCKYPEICPCHKLSKLEFDHVSAAEVPCAQSSDCGSSAEMPNAQLSHPGSPTARGVLTYWDCAARCRRQTVPLAQWWCHCSKSSWRRRKISARWA